MNHSHIRRAVVFAISLFVGTAVAADDADDTDDSPRWGLGLGAMANQSAYAGQDVRYLPLPLITYDSKRFFFQGVTGGIHLFGNDTFSIDAVVQPDFDGIDVEDFGRRELALNGIDRDLLEDRNETVQAGFQFGLKGQWGEVGAKFLADVLDESGGYEASFGYGYPIQLSEKLTVTPNLGVTWLSEDSADYYYGTLDEEIARGVVRYRPGSVAIPEAGVDVRYALSDKWMLLGSASYEALPDKISDSPLVDTKRSTRFVIGVMRSF